MRDNIRGKLTKDMRLLNNIAPIHSSGMGPSDCFFKRKLMLWLTNVLLPMLVVGAESSTSDDKFIRTLIKK